MSQDDSMGDSQAERLVFTERTLARTLDRRQALRAIQSKYGIGHRQAHRYVRAVCRSGRSNPETRVAEIVLENGSAACIAKPWRKRSRKVTSARRFGALAHWQSSKAPTCN